MAASSSTSTVTTALAPSPSDDRLLDDILLNVAKRAEEHAGGRGGARRTAADSSSNKESATNTLIFGASEFGPAGAAADVDTLVEWPADLPEQFRSLVLQLEHARNPNYSFILRRVYEAQQIRPFLAYLEKRIDAREADVEQLCEAHSLEMSDSLSTLRSDEPQVDELKNAARQIAIGVNAWQENVGELTTLGRRLHRCWMMQSRMLETLERIYTFRPILQLYSEVQDLFRQRQYVGAVRKIDHLVRLLQSEQQAAHGGQQPLSRLRFLAAIRKRIPLMKRQIRDEVVEQLSDVLEDAHVHSTAIGSAAMTSVAVHYGMTDVVAHGSTADGEAPISSIEQLVNIEPLLNYRYLLHMLGTSEDSIGHEWRTRRAKQAEHMVSAPPSNMMYNVDRFRIYLADVLSIFAMESYVHLVAPGISSEAWQKALWLQVAPHATTALRNNYVYVTEPEDVVRLKNQLCLFARSLARFACNPSPHIIALLEEVRDHYAEVLLTNLARQIQRHLDDDNFLPVQVNSLAQLRDAIGSFPYQLLLGDTTENDERTEFPKKLTFSRSTPALFGSFCEFVSQYARFSLDLPSAGSRASVASGNTAAATSSFGQQSGGSRQMEESTRRAVLIAIERTLTGSVMSFCSAERDALSVPQLVQLHANCQALEDAFRATLDQLVASYMLVGVGANSPASVAVDRVESPDDGEQSRTEPVHAVPRDGARYLLRERCRSPFEDLRAQLRERVIDIICIKVTELVQQAAKSYNWRAASSPTGGDSPTPNDAANNDTASVDGAAPTEGSGGTSSFIIQLNSFVREAFERIRVLPAKAVREGVVEVARRVHAELYATLIERVPCFSVAALQQVESDVEHFCAVVPSLLGGRSSKRRSPPREARNGSTESDAVIDEIENRVQRVFTPLHQLNQLVLKWNWDFYCSEYRKRSRTPTADVGSDGGASWEYSTVTPIIAAIVLEKLKEADKQSRGVNILAGLKKSVRERNKLIEQVMKQVKQLQSAPLTPDATSGGATATN